MTQSFFKESEQSDFKDATARRNKKSVLLFLLSASYGLLTIFIIYIKTLGNAELSLVVLYFYGIVGGIGLLMVGKSYTQADHSRKILNEVLDKNENAIVMTDPDGKTIYANAKFEKLVESQKTASILAFTRLFDQSDNVARQLEKLKDSAVSSGASQVELRTKIKDAPVWFHVVCQPIVGRPGFVYWHIDDITGKHQMETTLHEEQEKLRDFTDNAPVGFFSVDAQGHFQFANGTLLKLLGTDLKKLTSGAKLHDILVNTPARGHAYDCFEGGGTHQHGETVVKGFDGRLFKAVITHSIATDTDGSIITRSILHDLTSEQSMQQALRESQARFQRLFEEAPVGICLLQSAGVISDANQKLASMLGLPLEEINGKPLLQFVQKDMQTRAENWLQRLAKGENLENFIEVQLKGGVEIVAQIYARKFATEENFVLHFIDLTEQKNLEKQFTQSQKMQAIGQLAGGIAHDFNNLLTAMIGFCDLLLLRHKPGDASFADIMQIKQNANRAANLVRQLLAFSRQQTLQPRVLDATDVLSELSHLLRRLIGANIELTLNHGADLGLIRVDQGQMEQVLINLVVNARDAMPKGGKLLINTKNLHNRHPLKLGGDDVLPPGEWVLIEVKDTGTGIAADILPRIFEPFFSTKEIGAGTGLGLATVHGIIHQTGGFISVDSTVGVGTAFTVYLPRHHESPSEKKGTQEEKAVISDLTGSAKVLLVEDEDAVRTFSARALSNKGYQVVDAPGGVIALQLLDEKKIEPEILVTDVMMPEMDGTALAKKVKERFPKIKIIFMSGYAEDKFKEHLGAGVWFLPKPFTLKQLATKVKEVIEEGKEG